MYFQDKVRENRKFSFLKTNNFLLFIAVKVFALVLLTESCPSWCVQVNGHEATKLKHAEKVCFDCATESSVADQRMMI